MHSPETLRVEGTQTYSASASISRRLLAWGCDGALFGIGSATTILSLHFNPLPSWSWLTAGLLNWIGLEFLLVSLTGRSIGQWIWDLGAVNNQNRRTKGLTAFRIRYGLRSGHSALFKPLTTISTFVSLSLSVVTGLSLFWVAQNWYRTSPLLTEVQIEGYPPFVPNGAGTEAKDWGLAPFYFTLGAWPKLFQNQPVFFSLPYQKGPPAKFPPKVIARWKMPKIKLILEGPITETSFEKPDQIRNCFMQRWKGTLIETWNCWRLREKTLRRNVKEMAELDPTEWKITWFEVQNPVLPLAEWPKGLHLVATHASGVEERVILITEKGRHQTFTLQRGSDSDGEEASKLFHLTLRSVRIVDELQPGRAMINDLLSQTKLQKVSEDPFALGFIQTLAEVQALLISKFTVDPKDLYALHHLGGTALLFIQKSRELLRSEKAKDLPPGFVLQIDEWNAAVRTSLQSAVKYAQDISPKDPITHRLELISAEATKVLNP